jgi:predicted lipopolysaccharide heptosyltransferase III
VKILLVRLRLLGDVVFTTPLLRALRRQYPDAHLTYVVEPAAEPVIRANPHVNRVIVAQRRRGIGRLRDDLALARLIRNERFDIAIDLHGGPRGAWLTWASGAPRRLGYTTAGRTWMYTHPVTRPADLSGQHSVLKQWKLLAPLGVDACDPERDAVEMPEDAGAVARVREMLRHEGVREDDPVILLHVSAGNPFRRWPLESFAALVSQLAARDPKRRFVLTSGPSDADAARRLATRIAEVSAARVIQADVDVAELHALAARATVYIGGDSGPMHIAATTGTPIVGLFGPTLAERSMPWRSPAWFAEAVDAGPLPCRPCRQRTCEPGDFRCLTGITPDRVAAAAERALTAAATGGFTQPEAIRA